jgi:hypothetical protein
MSPRFQFRLRTLFVVATLLTLECAAAMWVIHDRQRLSHEPDEERERLQKSQAELDQKLEKLRWIHVPIVVKFPDEKPEPLTTQRRNASRDPFSDDQK